MESVYIVLVVVLSLAVLGLTGTAVKQKHTMVCKKRLTKS